MAGLAEDPAPSRRRAAWFLLILILYYAVFSYTFTQRILEYARDILLHFPFVRKYF